MYLHDGESMKLIYMNGLSKNYYPKRQSNTDKNCGRMIKPLICPRHRGFFFPKKGERANLPKNTHKTKDRRQRQTCTRTQQKCSHSTHTQLSTQIKKKCKDGGYDLCQANKQNYNRKIRRLQDQGSIS